MTCRFSHMSAGKLARFAVAFFAAVALFAALATTAFASPNSTTTCITCHSGAGTAPTVTLVSNNGATATYSVHQVADSWAAFDGSTRIAGDLTSDGTITGPVGHTFTVFSVGGYPGPIGQTSVTPDGGTTGFTITPTAGANGSISPDTTQTVASGANVTFTITANSGYHVSSVLVNGTSVGAVGSYTFTNVTANGTIAATFAADVSSYTITATAGPHGTISPLGPWSVAPAGSVSFLIYPDRGYKVATLLVDGAPAQLTGAYYTFDNVTADHTIAVTFASTLQKCTATINLTGLKAGVLKLHKMVTVKGTVKPAHSGKATVTIQRKVGTKWVYAKRVARTINATSGAYSYTYKPLRRGSYRVKTSVAKTARYTAAATAYKSFKVK